MFISKKKYNEILDARDRALDLSKETIALNERMLQEAKEIQALNKSLLKANDELIKDLAKLESENTNLVEQLDKKCFTCVSFNNRIAIERFAELLKLKAHPEDGCGLDCIYVADIDDELARIKTEELNKNDQT